MVHPSLAAIREVQKLFREWIDRVRTTADPSSEFAGTFDKISAHLRQVDKALREAPASVVTSEEWRNELAAYAGTLRELHARLGNLEIVLRIRRTRMAQARSHIHAIHSWADLAEHIG